ncbi:hypothetical protein GC1_00014 [Gluconobacter phage GC1]|uniref:Uncharacterized protein n=1 Tax=Gluconobacter phage GC1 TaxID=2047788 RepID=A0A2I5AR79_9VIRU|nr:hypothetical protein FDJ08_gp14 [Gluconobacter phage GC1]ATS92582.1 hypothetical protein GC1_00014 [Gluconobacter phage GC1]
MKVFGISIVTLLIILLVGMIIQAKFPSNVVSSKLVNNI